MRLKQILFVLIMLFFLLEGCGFKPQIVAPFNAGFTENEYIVIEVKDTDQLGLLFEAIPETDEKGNFLPLRWRQTSIVLFPQHKKINRVKETKIEQTRNAVETVKSSSRLTAVVVSELIANNESAFKYQSKSSKASRLIHPLRHNPNAKAYIKQMLEENKKYKFAYMSALYEGTAFVEVFTNVKISSGGAYAAFSIDGSYYTTNNRGVVTSGIIIFQLRPITIGELIEPLRPSTTEVLIEPFNILSKGFEPLRSHELNAIIAELPVNQHYLIKPNSKTAKPKAEAAAVYYDKNTGLKWVAGPDRDTTWYEAKSWVENLNVADGVWRMPTRAELKTLYKEGAGSCNMTPLLKITGCWVWSGEIKDSWSAWGFGFDRGDESWGDRDDSRYVRGFAVRF